MIGDKFLQIVFLFLRLILEHHYITKDEMAVITGLSSSKLLVILSLCVTKSSVELAQTIVVFRKSKNKIEYNNPLPSL